MKKIFGLGLVLVGMAAALVSCKKEDALKVGVCAGPYGDMFVEAIQPQLEKKGYKVKIIEFSDYVQPNNALAEKDIDVNMFQHSTYLKKFSADHKLELSYLTEIPTAAMGIFADKYKSVDSLPAGSVIAIPNDDTNLSRALRVLAQTGAVTIDPSADPSKATVKDLSENPKHFTFKEVSAEILPNVLDSVGAAIINGNYAIGAGLKLTDAIYNEQLLPGYFNVIAVRTEDIEKDFAKDIYSIVHSDEFRKVIEDPKKQYAAFGRPSGYLD
ncbi:D-methionine transport system substrate-binding protein [Treponema rectale]|uniref:D-methionine transport system substrate-binding protein n=1 Tax=Treponema rectale TaxID=744512 RepID=A0A840SGR4_9SPIR|nr:MetQ/NlpA family ABC transporter substrate-binding protein [Treponema rectale]MBB5219930.1 D-methionine transport system substrate-binding protein [Treponema rectale]